MHNSSITRYILATTNSTFKQATRRVGPTARYPFLALFLTILLTACAPLSIFGGTSTPTPASTPDPSTTATPTATSPAVEHCPPPLDRSPTCYTPDQLRRIYGVDTLIKQGYTGKGQTIVDIVSFGSPTLQRDMDIFDNRFGLPPITIKVISPLDASVKEYDPNGAKEGWAVETTVDVQIIHAIAPDANIVVLTSPVAETEGTVGLPEFRQLEQYAINNNLGKIFTHSWGASEVSLSDSAGRQEVQAWDTLLQNGTTKLGITYLASSGDSGATDYTDLKVSHLSPTPTTSFLADDPWVTSVGGTTVNYNGTSLNESVWNSNNGASGGGFSMFFPTPSYQKTLPATVQSQLNNRRGVPDVAADADPSTELAFFFSVGGWARVGGTSASAPLWAGIMAIANQMAGHPLGFINPGLYKLATSGTYAQDFHDITVGNNSFHGKGVNVQGYPAVQGWDPTTGLGTPNGEKLIPDLIAALQQ